MSVKSFPQTMNDCKLMLSGLKQNPERLAKRGLDADFTTKFEDTYNLVQTLDNEQEKLKAELKAKSESLQLKMTELNNLYSEARKIVKIEMEKNTWVEFGIQNKR